MQTFSFSISLLRMPPSPSKCMIFLGSYSSLSSPALAINANINWFCLTQRRLYFTPSLLRPAPTINAPPSSLFSLSSSAFSVVCVRKADECDSWWQVKKTKYKWLSSFLPSMLPSSPFKFPSYACLLLPWPGLLLQIVLSLIVDLSYKCWCFC